MRYSTGARLLLKSRASRKFDPRAQTVSDHESGRGAGCAPFSCPTAGLLCFVLLERLLKKDVNGFAARNVTVYLFRHALEKNCRCPALELRAKLPIQGRYAH